MLYRYAPAPYSVEVCDWIQDDSIFMQKAVWAGIGIVPHPLTHELTVALQTKAVKYSVRAGGYGDPITDPDIAHRDVPLYADANCVVWFNPLDPTDARNGDIISNRGATDMATWLAEMDARPEPLIQQSRFFNILMEHPIVMKDMILGEIRRADSPAHNKYAAVRAEAPTLDGPQ